MVHLLSTPIIPDSTSAILSVRRARTINDLSALSPGHAICIALLASPSSSRSSRNMYNKKRLSSIIAVFQAIALLLIGLPTTSQYAAPSIARTMLDLISSQTQGFVLPMGGRHSCWRDNTDVVRELTRRWHLSGPKDPGSSQAAQLVGSAYIAGLILVPKGRTLGLSLALIAYLWGSWGLYSAGRDVWVSLCQAGLAGLALAWKES